MSKFSIIEIVDHESDFRIALSIIMQGCIANDDGQIFSKSYQLAATSSARSVLKGLRNYINDLKIAGEQILLVVGNPEDMDLPQFQASLLPFVAKGVKIILIGDDQDMYSLAKYPDNVGLLQLNSSNIGTTLSTYRIISELLEAF